MTRGPEIWPTTAASMPKWPSAETRASATWAFASAVPPAAGGERRSSARSGSRYSPCDWRLEAVLERELVRLVGPSSSCCARSSGSGSPTTSGKAAAASTGGSLRGERGQPGQGGRRLARARGWLRARGRAADDVVRPAQDGADRGAGQQQDAGDGRGDAEQDAAGRADEAADQRIEIRADQPRARAERRGRGRA